MIISLLIFIFYTNFFQIEICIIIIIIHFRYFVSQVLWNIMGCFTTALLYLGLYVSRETLYSIIKL